MSIVSNKTINWRSYNDVHIQLLSPFQTDKSNSKVGVHNERKNQKFGDQIGISVGKEDDESEIEFEVCEDWKSRLLATHAKLLSRYKSDKLQQLNKRQKTTKSFHERVKELAQELDERFDIALAKLREQEDTYKVDSD
jgi:hypothetical protein